MTHDKNDCEFVVCFGALASSFGRPRHPRQPPCEAGAAAGFCENKSVQNFLGELQTQFRAKFSGHGLPNRAFLNFTRPEKKHLVLPVFWRPPFFFFKSAIFDLAPFWGSPSGRFSAIFGQTVFFRFPPGPKIPRFCL